MRFTRFFLWGMIMIAAPSGGAAVIQEDFSTDPLQRGWQIFGDTNLFQWDSTSQNLATTWDSSQQNSYFYRPLGTILAIDDDFSVAFDLQLADAQASGFFELAVGLLHFSDATNSNFSRGAAVAPNLFEFDYFPDGGSGPSIDATLADMTVAAGNTRDFYFAYDVLSLGLGVTYHIVIAHTAGQPTISGSVSTGGQLYTGLPQIFPGPITDFRLDMISITSYTATNNPFGDSILAHGTVDNLVVTLPPPPVQNLTGAFSNDVWVARFLSRSNWLYTLERTASFQSWTNVSPAFPGNGTNVFLTDANPPVSRAFYRVRANRP
jgi:hypothetical protein